MKQVLFDGGNRLAVQHRADQIATGMAQRVQLLARLRRIGAAAAQPDQLRNVFAQQHRFRHRSRRQLDKNHHIFDLAPVLERRVPLLAAFVVPYPAGHRNVHDGRRVRFDQSLGHLFRMRQDIERQRAAVRVARCQKWFVEGGRRRRSVAGIRR